MDIELVKFNKTSVIGIKKIGKFGIVIYIKNQNEFNEYVNLVKEYFYEKVENRFTPSKNITYYYYYIYNKLNKILIPRFLLNKFLELKDYKGEINYICNIKDYIYDENVEFNIINEPWDNKLKILEYIKNEFTNPFKSGLILDLPTGSGKTIMITSLAKYYIELGYRVHIIVTNNGLIKQTLDEFINKEYIWQLGGNAYPGVSKFDINNDYEDKRLLISTIHSLYNIHKKDNTILYDVLDKYYLTCIDEPQLITTKSKFDLLKIIQTKCMFGLSASASNSIFIKYYIGDIYKPDGFETVKFTCEVNKILYNGPDEYTKNITRWYNELGEELNCSMMTNLLIEKDLHRNKLIVTETIDYIQRHPCVLILSKNIKHIDDLYIMFSTFHYKDDINGKKILPVKWTGDRTQEEIDYALNKANIIIATYDSFGVGTNIPKITAIIYATSYKNEYKHIQFIGRAMRPHKDYNNIKREICDIIDTKVFLSNHVKTRNKIYKLKKFKINKKIVNYEDL